MKSLLNQWAFFEMGDISWKKLILNRIDGKMGEC